MDSKDFRLLVALHENGRVSYREMGKRVGLSAPAVRDRLKRLEEQRILQGYWIYIDPGALGREDLLVFFDGEYERDDALKLLEVPDVAFSAWKIDGGITVQLWPRERGKSVARLTTAIGSKPAWEAYTKPASFPDLSTADWRIIDALLDDPRMSLSILEEKTGLSPKTIRSHLHSMVRDLAVYILPRLGSLSVAGELVYNISIVGRVGVSQLKDALGDAVLVGRSDEPEMKYLFCRANDLADVTRRTKMAERLQGVKSVNVTLNRELFPANQFFHKLVREKIRDAEKRAGR